MSLSLQAAEHVIEGVMVKINRAGPRPEHEHSPDEKPPAATSTACPVCRPPIKYGASADILLF